MKLTTGRLQGCLIVTGCAMNTDALPVGVERRFLLKCNPFCLEFSHIAEQFFNSHFAGLAARRLVLANHAGAQAAHHGFGFAEPCFDMRKAIKHMRILLLV